MHGIHLLIVLSMFLLSGCMNMALTGAEAVYKHDYIEKKADDEWTRMQIYRTIYFDQKAFFAESHIVFAAFDNKLLLAGQAPQTAQRTKAEEIAYSLSPQRKIYNFIEVTPATSSLTRINDHWLTTKITSRFIAEKDFAANKINVFTENGTVFLMGSITVEEAERAVAITQKVDGVGKIVRMFTLYEQVRKK